MYIIYTRISMPNLHHSYANAIVFLFISFRFFTFCCFIYIFAFKFYLLLHAISFVFFFYFLFQAPQLGAAPRDFRRQRWLVGVCVFMETCTLVVCHALFIYAHTYVHTIFSTACLLSRCGAY